MINLRTWQHITLTPAQWDMLCRTDACPNGHKITIPGLDASACDKCKAWYGVMTQIETKKRRKAS
ncbi:hypothetical protein [Iningainema tapete]|uniref:Uncharacterized protein n=1 Tax=Iningainema tapete BLCC-T55 TaxID=2748662 RepID=A0A8J7C4A1_9CYAN|nr:hypothetical protein [Iningainema tapete]MBD2771194.1 hypothetical protein [Iningainema tapete BLCC-T55]